MTQRNVTNLHGILANSEDHTAQSLSPKSEILDSSLYTREPWCLPHWYDKLQLDIFGVSYATVGCGLLDAPPKIGTIFGFSKGNYMNCLRQCDFALQNHRRVRDAAPYDFCRNVCAKLQFPSFAKNGEGVLPSPLRNQIISDAHPQRTVPEFPDRNGNR